MAEPKKDPELTACTPEPLKTDGFNPECKLPHGLTTEHIRKAMEEFLSFLGFINSQMHTRNIPRLESFMMTANFSSLVGEFMSASLPKYCKTLAKNTYHNGHPDLVPAGMFQDNSVQHATGVGIEIKASRYLRGWQGHNAEEAWLLVFCFDSNTARMDKETKGVQTPKPFQFLKVLGAQLVKKDWKFSGRKKKSRRTITASVTPSGKAKMEANWIYAGAPATTLAKVAKKRKEEPVEASDEAAEQGVLP